jgi:drug/metabolite transporter (DMT)-like permease
MRPFYRVCLRTAPGPAGAGCGPGYTLVMAHRAAYGAWVVVCLVWGTTYLAIRIALETLPPFLMAAFRWLAAGGLIIAIIKVRRGSMPGPRAWAGLAGLGILLIGFGNGAVVWAEQTVPSGLTAVLVAAAPFWMVGIERLMPGADRLGARPLAGLLVGFGGIVLLVWPELQLGGGGRSFLGGAAATQLACLAWAVGSSFSRRRSRDEHVLGAAALQMFFAGVALLGLGLGLGEASALVFTPRTGAALLYLVLAGSVAGFTAYTYALKHLPLATVSLYAYVNPVIAVILGTLVLDEPMSPRIAVAGVTVLVGMALVRRG